MLTRPVIENSPLKNLHQCFEQPLSRNFKQQVINEKFLTPYDNLSSLPCRPVCNPEQIWYCTFKYNSYQIFEYSENICKASCNQEFSCNYSNKNQSVAWYACEAPLGKERYVRLDGCKTRSSVC